MKIEGTEASEVLNGTTGYDEIYGYAGDDTIIGGLGGDTLVGGLGNDLLDGWVNGNINDSAFNVASYWTADSAVVVQMQEEDPSKGTATGGAGNDTLINILGIIGSNYDDTLTGYLVEGGLGNDMLYGLIPSVAAVESYAVVSYVGAAEGVVVNLKEGTATGGEGNDTLIGFSSVSDSKNDDSLTGDDNDNRLYGSFGNDHGKFALTS